ncbi:MAG TPA: hypothetical protein VG496_13775 [Myxococcales bacterium]|nr:hypothetical protein [Myxococcales bacterium]
MKKSRSKTGSPSVDVHEGEKIDEKALKALIRAAVTLNESSARR